MTVDVITKTVEGIMVSVPVLKGNIPMGGELTVGESAWESMSTGTYNIKKRAAERGSDSSAKKNKKAE